MLHHTFFSMRDVFKLQPVITVFAFLITCIEKACLLLSRMKQGRAKGLAFSRRVINKTIGGDIRLAFFFSLSLSFSLFPSFEGNGVIKNCQLALERGRKSINLTQMCLICFFSIFFVCCPCVLVTCLCVYVLIIPVRLFVCLFVCLFAHVHGCRDG